MISRQSAHVGKKHRVSIIKIQDTRSLDVKMKMYNFLYCINVFSLKRLTGATVTVIRLSNLAFLKNSLFAFSHVNLFSKEKMRTPIWPARPLYNHETAGKAHRQQSVGTRGDVHCYMASTTTIS